VGPGEFDAILSRRGNILRASEGALMEIVGLTTVLAFFGLSFAMVRLLEHL
jgi:hypothetical protein